jgi:hypothetical protein
MLIGAGLLAASPSFAQVLPGQPKKVQPNIPQAAAPKGPDLSVRNVQLAGLEGRRARLNVFLAQPGSGQHQDKVTIFWVEGARRQKLWEGSSRFSSSRTGFQTEVSVDLPANRGNGRIEVVAGERDADPNWDNNVKVLELGGGDLQFAGRPEVEQIVGGNPNRKLKFEVVNQGPSAIGRGCKVEITIDGGRPTNVNLPELRPRQKHPVVHAFSHSGAPKPAQARIVCGDDPVQGNNTARTNVR